MKNRRRKTDIRKAGLIPFLVEKPVKNRCPITASICEKNVEK